MCLLGSDPVTLFPDAIFLNLKFWGCHSTKSVSHLVGREFPFLVLSMFWKGLTTRGAVIGGVVGLVTAVVLIILSKAVWVDTLKISDTPINPFNGPALFAMPLSFLCCWFFSVTDSSARAKKERASFDAQYVRSMTGIGASGASDH
jgi:cation/acetate symporter